jgi:pyruvate,orthophosphate dikinase
MRSGVTCHAAALLREMGKVAVVGVGYGSPTETTEADGYQTSQPRGCMTLDAEHSTLTCCSGRVLSRGDTITLDGTSGIVYDSKVPIVHHKADDAFKTLLHWADQHKRMEVLASAADDADIKSAYESNVDGIGILATEYMFTSFNELPALQRFIMSDAVADRAACMAEILPVHTEHVLQALRTMRNRPVQFRLLYPSLHHFMPENCFVPDTNPKLPADPKLVLKIAEELQEFNPLLGCKGSRLSILYPELTTMQVKAILGCWQYIYK